MKNIKDILTTIFAIVSIVAGAVNAYLQSIGTGEIDWFQLGIAIIVALVAYLTGKNPNGTTKTFSQIEPKKTD
jgi:hypothetical protein